MTFIEQQAQAWHEIREVFSHNETANGPGSTIDATVGVRSHLSDLLRRYSIETMLDAPCGDWNWLQYVNLGDIDYTGWDIEDDCLATARNRALGKHTFANVNLLTVKRIPTFDLIMCRDFTIHLTTEHVDRLLSKFRSSGSRYLLTTNYPAGHNDYTFPPEGHDDRPGYYAHPWNLESAPFSLPGRRQAIREDDQHELVLYDLSA